MLPADRKSLVYFAIEDEIFAGLAQKIPTGGWCTLSANVQRRRNKRPAYFDCKAKI
jgi:hypothetical protein